MKKFAPFLLFMLVLGIAYSPVLFAKPYGFCDDYLLLAKFTREPDAAQNLLKAALLQGRPLAIPITVVYFSVVKSISDFVYLRFWALISLTALACTIFYRMRAAKWDSGLAGAAALLVAAMPSFQVFMSWAITSSAAVIAAFSAIPVMLADRIVESSGSLKKKLLQGLAGLAVVFGQMCISPGSACFIWVFAAISLFRPEEDGLGMPDKESRGGPRRSPVYRLALYSFFFCAAAALEFALIKVSNSLTGEVCRRAALTTDWSMKWLWFYNVPLTESLNMARLFPSTKVAQEITLLIVVGLLLYFRGSILKRLTSLLVCAAFIPLAYLPNLVVIETWAPYRTKIALSALIVVYVVFACYGIWRTLLRFIPKFVLRDGLAGVAALCLFWASCNVYLYFALPQSLEVETIKAQLVNKHGNVSIVVPDTLAPGMRYDEFGVPSSRFEWVTEPMKYLVSRELTL